MSEENNNSIDEQLERVNFDLKFQMAVLKMMFTDDHFCSQMTRYLGGDDKELQKYVIFETEDLHIIFKTVTTLFKEYSVRPSPAAVRQRIQTDKWVNNIKGKNIPIMVPKEQVLATVDKVMELSFLDDRFYRDNMTEFIQGIKIKKAHKILKEEMTKNATPKDIISVMQTRIDDLNRVSFEAESLMTLKMVPKLIEESAVSMGASIPTGIKELDKDLHGGLPRDSLIVVLSGTNVGKSMFCISAGAQALKALDNTGKNLGLKVLMVPLEGQKQESIMRFAACMTNIEYGKLINNTLTDDERKVLEKTLVEYDESRLQVLNMLEFNVTIESLIAVAVEKYKEFKFDVLIVDYGQLLSTVQKTEGHRFTMAVVFRGLSALARKLNCVVMSPAQATRQGQENLTESNQRHGQKSERLPILRSADISEAFEIARVAGVILSLNMTDSERAEKKLRVFLEKQRHGVKDKTYGLITDYARCNLITGQFYNPRSNIMDINAVVGQMETQAANKDSNSATSAPATHPVNTFSLNSWFNENGASLDELANKQKLSGLIDFIKERREKLKHKLEELQTAKEEDPFTIDEEDSIYSALRKEYEEMEEEIKNSIKEYMDIFTVAYPGAKLEDVQVLKGALAKMKENKAKGEELKKVEEVVARLEFRFTDAELKDYGNRN